MYSVPMVPVFVGLLLLGSPAQAHPGPSQGIVWPPPRLPGSPTPRPCPCPTQNLCRPVNTPAKYEVFMFMGSDSNYPKYDWTRITTAVLYGKAISDKVMCYAHSKGVRVSYLVDFPVNQLTNATSRTNWVQSQLAFAQDHFMDGINLDFEAGISAGDVARREGLNLLVSELTTAFKANLDNPQVTFDGASSPHGYRHFDYIHIASTMDFLFLMAYDESGSCRAGANSGYGETIGGAKQFVGIGISPRKLVLGLPWYGYDYPCEAITKENKCVLSRKCGGHQVSYTQAIHFSLTNTSSRFWDKASLSPFINHKDSKGMLHQTWYDDKESLSLKYKWASASGLRGIGIWQVDGLDYSDTPSGRKERADMWGALPVVNGQRKKLHEYKGGENSIS